MTGGPWAQGVHVVLPWARPPVLANDHGTAGNRYAAAALRKRIRTQAAAFLRSCDLPDVFGSDDHDPLGSGVVVVLTWYPGDNRPRDADGMAPTMKPVLDALVDALLLADDNASVVKMTAQRIVPRALDPGGHKFPRLVLSVLPADGFGLPHFPVSPSGPITSALPLDTPT